MSTNPESSPTFFNKKQARSIFKIGLPLIVNNLAIMSMNLADTIMSGRHSTDSLAAVAAGGAVWTMVFLAGMGILMALSPVTAQYHASGQSEKAGFFLRQTLWLALLLGIPLLIIGQNLEWVFSYFGLEPEIVSLADEYLSYITLSLPFVFAYMSLRMTSEGIGHTRPIMYIAIFCACLNVLFNWVLIYGKWGFPEMGAAGCGLASAIIFVLMLLLLGLYVAKVRVYKPLKIFSKFEWPQKKALSELLILGVPIGVSILAEISLFSIAALLMGSLGKNVLAAHQIALNYAAFMFMVPFGMSMANTSVVGQLIGQKKMHEARTAGYTGIILATGFMAVSAIVMILFAQQIIGLYTQDAVVAKIAVSLLGMAAAFQIVDGIQVAASGALRGFKDTQIPMYINLFSYWPVGFLMAWYLGIKMQLGPTYIWGGLVGGLLVASILLTWRFTVLSRKAVRAET